MHNWMKSFNDTVKLCIVHCVLCIALFGCKNEMKDIQALTPFDTVKKEMSRDIVFEYTEFGIPQFKMLAPIMVSSNENSEEVMTFENGILIYFYDENGEIGSEISSLYATNNTTKKLITLKNNVIIIDYNKREKIKTDELYWDQNTKKIWSEKFVKIITDDKQLEGYGFETDESIENYVITQPTGVFSVSEDEEIKKPNPE